MNRYMALSILKLPQNATREQIVESYNQLRSLYYPDCYGQPHEFTPQQIQESLYADLSRDYYKEPKGVQYRDLVKDAYHHALLEYARVCDAYDYLTDPANQNKYNVDPRSPYGHDVLRYGLGFAGVRKVITWLVSYLAKPVLIVFLISGLLDVMGNGEYWYFTMIANVSKILYLVLMGSAVITMPMDTLGYIPRGIGEGMREGAKTGPAILRPITVLLMGIWGGLGRIFHFLWNPREMMDERSYHCNPPVKNAKKGRAAAETWYRKTVANIEELRKNGGVRISEDMPVVRKVLEELAENYKRKKRSIAYATACGDMDMKFAEKNIDLDIKLYGDSELALDDYARAYQERRRMIESSEGAFVVADRLFRDFAFRAGADPEKYIKE